VDFEIVVVDDGSRDATPFWLAQASSERLRVVRHPISQGLPRARNAGIAAARGVWLAFLDDDDLWAPDKLRVQLDTLAATGAAWGFGAAFNVDDRLRLLAVKGAPDAEGLADRLLLEQVIPAGPSNVIVRATLVEQLGGFDDAFPVLADWDFFIRLAEVAPAAVIDTVSIARVHHAEAMHAQRRPADLQRELQAFLDKHRARREDRQLTFSDRAFLRWVASGQVEAGHPWSASWVHLRDGWRRRDLSTPIRAARGFLGPQPLRHRREPTEPPPWLARYQ
jgi:glycosyltransferase involved in cell wall biosynthesis